MDAALAPTAAGRARSVSFFQVAGTAPATKEVSVSGNFPAPTPAQTASGATAGLVKASTGTGAMVDGIPVPVPEVQKLYTSRDLPWRAKGFYIPKIKTTEIQTPVLETHNKCVIEQLSVSIDYWSDSYASYSTYNATVPANLWSSNPSYFKPTCIAIGDLVGG